MCRSIFSQKPESAGAVDTSAYARAITLLRDAVSDRARLYRGLVIAVVSFGAMLVGVAWLTRSWAALTGLLALPVGVLVFAAADLRRVNRWRDELLIHWCRGELELAILKDAAKHVPGLPAETVAGLLDHLPAWPCVAVPPQLRLPLCQLQTLVGGWAIRRLVWRTACWLVGACLSVVVIFRLPAGVMAGLALGLVMLLTLRARWQRQGGAWPVRLAGLLSAAETAGLSPEQMAMLVDGLCWEGVPIALRYPRPDQNR